VDADSNLEVLVLAHPLPDRQRRSNGPLGIILTSNWCAEDRHDGVADELLDSAAEPLELGPEPCVVPSEERADGLWVQAFGTRREADEIREQDGDRLSLFPQPGDGRERGCACEAEPRDLRIVLPAVWADRHRRSLVRAGCVFVWQPAD